MKEKSDAYVFISYSRANQGIARDLFNNLTSGQNRLTCWMDVFDIQQDETTFQQQIVKGIQNASCLVFVETEESKKSSYVHLELDTANQQNIPVLHYRTTTEASPRKNKLKTFWLAQRIKFRVTQPFWVSLIALIMVFIFLAASVFFLGAKITPVLANAVRQSKPEPIVVPTVQPTTIISQDPELIAPFHINPDKKSFVEDFSGYGPLNDKIYQFRHEPTTDDVKINQQDGFLQIHLPNSCIAYINEWACAIYILGPRIDFEKTQYIGFRIRTPSRSPLQYSSISLSYVESTSQLIGYGWSFSDHATPFFRSNPMLPEQDFYAYVDVNEDWHAYEIVINPATQILTYYIDGQIIDQHNIVQYENWKKAPLYLSIYSRGGSSDMDNALAQPDTDIEIDQIVLGSFK